jgi:hypothetical protein
VRYERALVLALARSSEPPNPDRCATEPQKHPDRRRPAKARPNAIEECPGGRQYVHADQDTIAATGMGGSGRPREILTTRIIGGRSPQEAAGMSGVRAQ